MGEVVVLARRRTATVAAPRMPDEDTLAVEACLAEALEGRKTGKVRKNTRTNTRTATDGHGRKPPLAEVVSIRFPSRLFRDRFRLSAFKEPPSEEFLESVYFLIR